MLLHNGLLLEGSIITMVTRGVIGRKHYLDLVVEISTTSLTKDDAKIQDPNGAAAYNWSSQLNIAKLPLAKHIEASTPPTGPLMNPDENTSYRQFPPQPA